MSAVRIVDVHYEPAGRARLGGEAIGQLVAVRGANGSGKSTLARLLCGLDPRTTGHPERAAALTVTTAEGQRPWRPGDAWLIALDDLEPATMISTADPTAWTTPGTLDGPRAAVLARIDTARAALSCDIGRAPAWLLDAASAGRRVPPPPPPPMTGGSGDRLAQLDAAIDEARAALDAALPDESTLRQALQALRDLDEPAALETALPDLGAFLEQARRHFPALVVSVAGLVLLAGLLMASGQSRLAAPFALLAVSGALLVLLAPPLRREPVAPHGLHGLHGLARALRNDGDLIAGPAADGFAAHRREVLAGLSLPLDVDAAGVQRRRRELEAQLSARLSTDRRRAELQSLIATRDAMRRDAVVVVVGPTEPTEAADRAPAPGPASVPERAPDDWTALLDRRRELIRANVAEQYAERAEERRRRTEAARRELDRLRRSLAGPLDTGLLELASQWLVGASAGRLTAVRTATDGVDGELDVDDAAGATRPLELLARSDRQLVGLSLQLAAAEQLRPGMPLVLDDVLVGLDDRNLKAVCAVLAELAERRQVIVLTASVAVTDSLRRARRSTRVLELR